MSWISKIAAHLRWLFRRTPDRVEVDPVSVRGYCGDSQVWVVRWDNLEDVMVETTDRGPEEDNCFLILGCRAGDYRIPSETPGFPNVVNALAGCLEGIDENALIKSMGWQENHEFLIWEKPAD